MQFLVLALLPLAALVILIVLIAKTTGNSTRIGTLEWEIKNLRALERRINELSASIEGLKRQLEELLPASSARKKELRGEKPEKQPVQPEPPSAVTIPPIPAAPQRPMELPKPSRTREEWEALIGGKLLNRIGALALIIGIGFFLKYAFDNNWINETVRVLIGGAIGIVCLTGGYRTNKKGYQVFAQGMVGAGIAILYLSVYAAFNYYQLMPQWEAFVFMAMVTVIAFLNGLFYDSLAEGILGWAGGFLTPVLLSTGQANEIGLFTYIALLDAGLLAMVAKKETWAILEPLAFVGTWLMYLMWRAEYYGDTDLWITVLYVTLFWFMFLVSDYLRYRKPNSGESFRRVVPALNALIYFLAVYFLIDNNHHSWMGLATLTIGAVYFSIYLVQRRHIDLRDELAIRHTLIAVALLIVATSIQFSNFDTVIFWSIEAALLAWCSQKWKLEHIQTAALVLFGLTIFNLIVLTDNALMFAPIREFMPILNHRALAFTVLAGSLGFAAFSIDRSGDKWSMRTSNAFHFAWCAILFLLVTAETVDFFRFKMLDQPSETQSRLEFFRLMTFAVVWITLSLPLIWVGLRKKLFPLVFSGLVCALLAIVFGAVRGISFDPIESFIPVINVRSIALILLTTGLLLLAQFIQRSPASFDWLEDILSYVQVGMVLIIFVLLTGETRDFFQKDIVSPTGQAGFASSELVRLGNLQQMSLSGVWLLYSAVLMAVGIWRKFRGMRFVAMVLFGISILKIFIYDLSFLETLYRFISFIALGVILIAVSYAYQKYKDIIGVKS